MAVVNVTEKWSPRSTGFSDRGEVYTGVYSVLLDGADTPQNAPRVARLAAGVPQWGTVAPWSFWLIVRNVQVRTESVHLFEVTVTWEPREFSGQPNPADPDPTALPPEISFEEDVTTEPVDEDVAGDAITNSSGEPFDPPLQRPFSDPVIVIERNVATYNLVFWQPRLYTTNNAIVTIDGQAYATGTLRLRSAKAKRILVGASKYYALRIEIGVRIDGWNRRVLDQGYREQISSLTNGTPVYKNIVDEQGNPVTSPVPLDGLGGVLKSEAPASDPPVYLAKVLFPPSDFSALPLTG